MLIRMEQTPPKTQLALFAPQERRITPRLWSQVEPTTRQEVIDALAEMGRLALTANQQPATERSSDER